MTTLLRSLRGFGIAFLILSALLLIARLGIGSWAAGMQDTLQPEFVLQAIDTLLLIVSLAFTVFVVILTVWMLFLAVRWALTSILNAPAVKDTQPLNRLFGLVAVSFFFGSLLKSLYLAFSSLISGLFTGLPDQIVGAFRNGMFCIQSTSVLRYDVVDSSCIVGFLSDMANTIRLAADDIFLTSGLSQINPVSLVAAAAVFAIVAIGSSRVRSDLQTRDQFWLAYGAVAFFAVYLTLSAILAVPLLSQDTTEEPRPAEDLKTTLAQMVPVDLGTAVPYPGSDKSLSAIFTVETVSLSTEDGTEALRQAARGSIDDGLTYLRQRASEIETNLQSVRTSQNQIRNDAEQALRNQAGAAASAYEFEIDVRKGKREANQHFLSLRSWYQTLVGDTIAAIRRCDDAVARVESQYVAVLDDLSPFTADITGSANANETRGYMDSAFGRMEDVERSIRGPLRDAQFACETSHAGNALPPNRRNYGSYLGVVGLAASWLLSTESMEVTLITGLIGFGLLGAMVAQFVKSGGSEEFDMARIATVVFSGFCAAIVVYVAAYGGLAIASTSGSDPNPYVVFGACLVGAVFSAEIWERAKSWFLS